MSSENIILRPNGKELFPHDSIRGIFAYELYREMQKNENIWIVVPDVGYGVFDAIRADFPNRFINTGAAEQAGLGICVGLALSGKIPVFYSITPFAVFRPFETIRNYLHHDRIPVKLVGSGRNRDYSQDGVSHWAEEDRMVMAALPNIISSWPETKEEIPGLVESMLYDGRPHYINLKR